MFHSLIAFLIDSGFTSLMTTLIFSLRNPIFMFPTQPESKNTYSFILLEEIWFILEKSYIVEQISSKDHLNFYSIWRQLGKIDFRRGGRS